MSDCFDHMGDAFDEMFSGERDYYEDHYTRKKFYHPRRFNNKKKKTVKEQLLAPNWGEEVDDDDIKESMDFLNAIDKPIHKGFVPIDDDKSDAPF